mgnify:CR=1 FL=1|jgi:hypothetical protein
MPFYILVVGARVLGLYTSMVDAAQRAKGVPADDAWTIFRAQPNSDGTTQVDASKGEHAAPTITAVY